MAAKKAAEKFGPRAKPAPAGKASKKPAANGPAAKKPKAGKAPRLDAAQVLRTYQKLRAHYPGAHCELDHKNPFQLVVATVLSAQSTDVMVNKITPELFRRWPTPKALAEADPAVVERTLNKIGMYRQKTKNVIGLSKKLIVDHAGQVPHTLDELVALPGVGRKTANVVLGVAFGTPEGVVVDTHVQRISQRLGWTRQTQPPEIERELMALFPRTEWDMLSHTLIFHGRRVCAARKPACAACPVSAECPSAFHADQIGRKPARDRSQADGRARTS